MIIAQLAVAFLVAWSYYTLAMAVTVYDGLPSLIFQPIMGALCAGVAVLLCFLLGLPIRLVARLRRFWQHICWLPFFLGTLGFVLMVVSWQPPFRQTVHDYASDMVIQTFQPGLALAGWLLSIFAALYFWFPLPKLPRPAHSAGHAHAPFVAAHSSERKMN